MGLKGLQGLKGLAGFKDLKGLKGIEGLKGLKGLGLWAGIGVRHRLQGFGLDDGLMLLNGLAGPRESPQPASMIVRQLEPLGMRGKS